MFARGKMKMSKFIPKENKYEQISIRLPKNKIAIVTKLATDNNLSRSKFIEQCIDYAIDNMPKPEK